MSLVLTAFVASKTTKGRTFADACIEKLEGSNMHIGVPAETRANEARVDAKPETVKKRVSQGHRVTVQSGAGLPASYINDAYATAGAELVDEIGRAHV